MNHSISSADVGGKSRWYHFEWGPKSVITRPSAGMEMPGRGYVHITGLAWSGGGKASKVDVSTDGGRSWKEATLQTPVHTKAHTRFNFDWAWDGEEAMLLSRCTDERGEVQPSRAELYETGASPARTRKNPSAPLISMPFNPGRLTSTAAYTMRCTLSSTPRSRANADTPASKVIGWKEGPTPERNIALCDFWNACLSNLLLLVAVDPSWRGCPRQRRFSDCRWVTGPSTIAEVAIRMRRPTAVRPPEITFAQKSGLFATGM